MECPVIFCINFSRIKSGNYLIIPLHPKAIATKRFAVQARPAERRSDRSATQECSHEKQKQVNKK